MTSSADFNIPIIFSLDKEENLRFSNGLYINTLSSLSEEEYNLFLKRLEPVDSTRRSFKDGFLVMSLNNFIFFLPSGLGFVSLDLPSQDDWWSFDSIEFIEGEDDGNSLRRRINYYVDIDVVVNPSSILWELRWKQNL